MVAVILIVLFALLLLYVLLVPVIFNIDTATHEYFIQLRGLAKASVEKHNTAVLRIRLKVLFMTFYFYPLQMTSSTSKKKKISKRRSKKKKRSIGIRKIIRLLRSFKVKHFVIDIDTGDCILNARLFPVFAFLNYYVGTFKVNFEDRNHFALRMQNRPIYLLRAFINQ